MTDILKLIPPMLTGAELHQALAVNPEYDPNICNASAAERLIALNTLFDIFFPFMYWHLDAGNWHEGSESPAKPEIPEEIMEAEVTQVETAPDVARLFYNLSYSICNSYHFTVVLVEEPADFDSKEYWLGKIHGRPITKSDWVLSINEERWDELYESCPDSQMALNTILNSSIKMFREYTEEDFSKMDAAQAQAYRKAQKLAQKIVTYDDLLVTFYMTSLGELFRKNWRF